MFRVPEAYRIPLGIAIALHIGLIFWLILRPTTTSYRTDAPSVIVHATVVSSAALRVATQARPPAHRPPAPTPVPVQTTVVTPPPPAAAKAEAPSLAVPVESPDAKLLAAQAEHIKAMAIRRATEARAHQELEAVQMAALQKEQQQLQQKMLARELAQEEKSLQQQRVVLASAKQAAQKVAAAAANQGILDRYRAAILSAIRGNWHPPAQTDLMCQLVVHLGPGGVVLSVDLVQSSGDPALDQSAQVAVMKASPLPVPEDSTLFDEFRTFRIRMSPQEVT